MTSNHKMSDHVHKCAKSVVVRLATFFISTFCVIVTHTSSTTTHDDDDSSTAVCLVLSARGDCLRRRRSHKAFVHRFSHPPFFASTPDCAP
uniref:Secreted protein n=1 Tax=Steinernema glaseri TaxID=37863 RepID=A0A1I7ZDL3_9BILA